jgi:hypothetical protein
MSKKPTGWTAKEWAQILGVKWLIKDLNNMEFLPTDTSASHMCAGSAKKKSSSKSFSAEEWSKILWPAKTARKQLKKLRAEAGHICISKVTPPTPATCQKQKSPLLGFTAPQWAKILGVNIKDYLPGAKCHAHISEWKEPKPKKPIEPFTMESFIRTGRAMTEDQKRILIQKAVQGKDDFLNAISPASWAHLLEVKSVFWTKYKSLRVPTLLQSLQGWCHDSAGKDP